MGTKYCDLLVFDRDGKAYRIQQHYEFNPVAYEADLEELIWENAEEIDTEITNNQLIHFFKNNIPHQYPQKPVSELKSAIISNTETHTWKPEEKENE